MKCIVEMVDEINETRKNEIVRVSLHEWKEIDPAGKTVSILTDEDIEYYYKIRLGIPT
jgi:hypothetical protein